MGRVRLVVGRGDQLVVAGARATSARRPPPGPASGLLTLQRLVGNAGVASLLSRQVTVQRSGCDAGCACSSCAGDQEQLGATAQRATEGADGTDIDAVPAEELPRCTFGEEPAVAAATTDDELTVMRSPGGAPKDCSPTTQQNATVVCDGGGGFRVHYGAYENRPWLKPCVTKHEQSHIHDFQRDAPGSCKNPDGTPVCDGERAGDHVRFTKQGVDAGEWQRKSECTAPHIGHKCGEAALAHASLDYQQSWQAYLKNEQALIDANCS